MTPSNGRYLASGSVRCEASIDLRTVATEFVAMGCTQFPEILPFGNFFPGNEKFFRDPGKSSPVNIPSQYIIKLGGFLQKLGVEVH